MSTAAPVTDQSRYVQLPNGSYMEWPQGVSAEDFKAKAATVGGAPPDAPPEQTMMQKVGQGAEDFGKGMLKGAGSTAESLGHLVLPDWALKMAGKTPPGPSPMLQPTNTMQRLGKGTEQVGEFMLPGGIEEKGAAKLAEFAPKLGKMAEPLSKMATSAMGSGLVNKAQGGSFGTGAAMGAGGQVVGQALKAAAPVMAETALGMPKAARAFAKTPGKAILEDTRGIRPETIASSAQDRMSQLTPELESQAASSTVPASLAPARNVVGGAIDKATSQNAESLVNQLTPQRDFLSRRFDTGQPIPADTTPSDLLNLKRGFSKEFMGRWNPETHGDTTATGRRAYGAMDQELDRTVPQAAGLNQRISSLIPVAQRAESVSRNAPTLQRAMGRFGAHTGALVGAGMGGSLGYREGGLPGAVAGGITGVLAPELLASPEGQMAAARLMNHAGGLKPLVGTAAQFTKKDK